jgi:hypothetical protein
MKRYIAFAPKLPAKMVMAHSFDEAADKYALSEKCFPKDVQVFRPFDQLVEIAGIIV